MANATELAFVKVYSYSSSSGKLSDHFNLSEFRCHDGSDTVFVDPELITLLEIIRERLGNRPITVNSGYRTESYNEKTGGVKYSKHKYGMAADISVKGLTSASVYEKINAMFPDTLGLGLYDSFVHVDTRRKRARWDYRKNK